MAHRSSDDGNYQLDEPDDADGEAETTNTVLEEVAAGAKLVAASPLASSAAASANRYNPEQHRCLVCYTDLVMVAHTPCHHDEICGLCHLRLRYLHEDFKCPICKAVNEHLVVDHHNKHNSTKNKQFEDYPIWGDDLGTDFVYAAKGRMFFPKKYYDTVVYPLFGYHCQVKNCPQSLSTGSASVTATDKDDNDNTTNSPVLPTTLRQLQDHLRTAHRLTLCQLCCDHQRDFVAQLPRYSPSGLQRHYTNRGGHPVCEFCRPTRFYDLTALHQHLHQEHYKCHVCEQHLELPNQFFANYRSLERHFDGKHYLCHDVQCLTARFVVFANELDLRHHERQVHGSSSMQDSKLQIEFRVRRHGGGTNTSTNTTGEAPTDADFNYSLDGQAFVPASLPSRHSQNTITTSAAATAPSSLHPPHVQRTNELRQEAERLRQQQQDSQSFPALGEAMATTEHNANASLQQQRPNNRLTVGWNEQSTLQLRTQRAGVVTPEEFPSLVANNKPNGKQKKSANLSSGWSSTPGLNQNTGGGATRALHSRPTMTTLTPLSRSSALRSSQNSNNVTSLAVEHFPALMANGNATQKYAAAQALAKKTAANHNNNAASQLQAEHFPALSGGSKKPAPKKAPPPPPVANDFPSLSRSTPNRNISLDDIKATLGTQQYKRLKGFTQEYATGALAPEAYVDHAASVFPQGYADVDFWNIVPVLLQSCPNLRDNEVARQYLQHLQRMRTGARNVEHFQQQQQQQQQIKQQQQQPSTWTSSSTTNALLPPESASREKPAPASSWGKTHAGNVTTQPSAVSAATATKVSTKTNKKKGKGNQKNELRALAFGGS